MTPRRAARVDANQPAIVAALRAVGASVSLTHRVGGGFPDLCVGFRGKNWILEVKTEKGSLNKMEQDFFRDWRGQRRVVRTPEEALKAIGAIE